MIISVYNLPQNKLIPEIGYSKIKPIYVNSQNFINSPLYYYLDDEITSKIKPIFNELHEKYDSSQETFLEWK